MSGNIYLAADDNFEVTGANTTIGGAGFSGTVWMQGNRDLSTNGQPTEFTVATEAIVTSNTTNQSVALSSRTPTTQAVYMDIGGGTSGPGLIVASNITVGNGGRVVLNGRLCSGATESGTITMVCASDSINVGSTGTLELDAISQVTTAPADYIGTSAIPIKVAGGNVVINSQYGNVWVTGTAATNFSAAFTSIAGQTGSPTLNLTTTSGATDCQWRCERRHLPEDGTINLTGAGGVVVSAQLGNATTGAININGPLSGSGNIVEGTGAVTINQNTTSSYAGAVSGGQAVNVDGTGSLALTGASNGYTGATSVINGTLTVGNLSATSGVTLGANATLASAGSGSVNSSGTVVVSGAGATVTPGGTSVGTLNTGSVSATAAANLDFNINGTGTGGTNFDLLNVTGTMNLNNFTPVVYVGSSPTLSVGNTFTVIATTGGVTGSFPVPQASPLPTIRPISSPPPSPATTWC